jgi:hypothetical protein
MIKIFNNYVQEKVWGQMVIVVRRCDTVSLMSNIYNNYLNLQIARNAPRQPIMSELASYI